MKTPELIFHKPPLIKRLGEKLRVSEITPADIVSYEQLGLLLQTYRDLAGDLDIGIGNDGNCQSWRGNRGWWKAFFDNK